ncbi:MAG: alpha/beta fold hydrolase [Actinobacteria bacterium]|nr:alpha/beta fold hydrolase [Actinomycetota bacterium]
MSASARLIPAGIRAIGAVSPALAARLALRLFFTTSPRMAVRDDDLDTHLQARRERIRIRGSEVVVYRWGRGERAVLLLHGWQGRASQFAPLVRELVADGLRVVSFDAPAHGGSDGRHTDLRDWVAAAEHLQRTDGPFHALVGHSFGGLAALTAARTTVPVPRVAVIASAASPAAFLAEFSGTLRLSPAVATRFGQRFAAHFDMDPAEVTATFDGAENPLPAGTELLVVHDRADHRMPDSEALRLHAAHIGRSRLLRTEGFGHNRVLRADPVLDAVTSFLGAETPKSGTQGPAEQRDAVTEAFRRP